MKTLALLRSSAALALVVSSIFALGACGSGSSTSPAAGSPSEAQAAQNAEEEKNCRRSLTGPGKRQEGEECGGSTNLSCADGLKCVSKYRCPGSIGTCKKE